MRKLWAFVQFTVNEIMYIYTRMQCDGTSISTDDINDLDKREKTACECMYVCLFVCFWQSVYLVRFNLNVAHGFCANEMKQEPKIPGIQLMEGPKEWFCDGFHMTNMCPLIKLPMIVVVVVVLKMWESGDMGFIDLPCSKRMPITWVEQIIPQRNTTLV